MWQNETAAVTVCCRRRLRLESALLALTQCQAARLHNASKGTKCDHLQPTFLLLCASDRRGACHRLKLLLLCCFLLLFCCCCAGHCVVPWCCNICWW